MKPPGPRSRRRTPPDRKRDAQEIEFVVRYPWGGSYCRKLRAALRQLGVPTMHDPFNDGSDSDGFFVADDKRRCTAARRLIRDYDRYLEAGGDDRFDDVIMALATGGVHEVMQDWKYLSWEADVPTLARIGLRLRLTSTRHATNSEELTFRIGRVRRRRRHTE